MQYSVRDLLELTTIVVVGLMEYRTWNWGVDYTARFYMENGYKFPWWDNLLAFWLSLSISYLLICGKSR